MAASEVETAQVEFLVKPYIPMAQSSLLAGDPGLGKSKASLAWAAEVTRGGGLKYERVVFVGPSGKVRTEVHLKRGHVRKLEQFGFASRVPDADDA